MFDTLNCCCILCWRLYMEECGPTILYHPGKKSIIADTFSWLPHCDVLPIPMGENVPVVLFDFTSISLDINNDPELLKCFFNLPLPNFAENKPVDLKCIQTQQNISGEVAMINTSINLLMVVQLYAMPYLMKTA